jgi:hypothetical protein
MTGDLSGRYAGLGGAFNYFGSQPAANMARGVYGLFEMVAICNTNGAQNGVIRAWWRGQMICQATDVPFNAAGESPKMDHFAWRPIYGAAVNNPPRDMWMRCDRFTAAVGTTGG